MEFANDNINLNKTSLTEAVKAVVVAAVVAVVAVAKGKTQRS